MSYALHIAWTSLQAIAPFLVLVLIPSVINALLPYPRAQGAIRALHVLLDALSLLVRNDSPGTLKLPLTTSKAPSSPRVGTANGVARGAAPLLVLMAVSLLSASGCGSASTARWKATGIGPAKCVAPELGSAIGTAVIDLLDAVEQNEKPDYQQIGLELAQRYGVDAAICAAEVAWQHLGPGAVVGGAAPANTTMAERASALRSLDPPSPRQARRVAALDWLVHHESSWARAPATPAAPAQ